MKLEYRNLLDTRQIVFVGNPGRNKSLSIGASVASEFRESLIPTNKKSGPPKHKSLNMQHTFEAIVANTKNHPSSNFPSAEIRPINKVTSHKKAGAIKFCELKIGDEFKFEDFENRRFNENVLYRVIAMSDLGGQFEKVGKEETSLIELTYNNHKYFNIGVRRTFENPILKK